MAPDPQDFSSPQEAIEGYLEALLQDVAEYDEPEQSPKEQAGRVDDSADVQASSDTIDLPDDSASETANEPGTRVFAPPSARAYAREAAAQIKQRQKSETVAPKVDFAFKESPSVVMPELKVAEVDTAIKADPVVEAPAADVPRQKVEPETPSPVVETPAAEPLAAEKQASEPELKVNIKVDTLAESATTDKDGSLVAQEPQQNEGWTKGRPDWAQNRFECLLFVVKGLKLAVPLAELGGIHKLEKAPTPLFGQPGWFLGIVRTNNMNVGLVDTAQWVMSEHIKDDHKPDFKFAIRIHNSEWGLACHEVAEAI